MAQRIPEFDIMKGILIILVVIGHALPLHSPVKWVVSWFHVSAFFLVSGVFRKVPADNPLTDRGVLLKYLHRYLVPMCVWLALTWLVAQGAGIPFGRMLVPYWFIRALVVAHLAVAWMDWAAQRMHRPWVAAVMLCGVWGFIHIPELPEMHRVVQMMAALVFVYLGRSWASWVRSRVVVAMGALLAAGYLTWSVWNEYPVYMNVAEGALNHFVADLLVPLMFATATYFLSQLLAAVHDGVFSYVGKASLAVFYVHIPVLWLMSALPDAVRIAVAVAMGVAVYAVLTSPRMPAPKVRNVLARYLLGIG